MLGYDQDVIAADRLVQLPKIGAGGASRGSAYLGVAVRTLGTGVFLEVLLCDTVECERRHGTLQARSRNVPMTTRAAPARETFIFDPDHASQMFDPYWTYDSETELPLEARATRGRETPSVKVNWSSPRTLFHEKHGRQSDERASSRLAVGHVGLSSRGCLFIS